MKITKRRLEMQPDGLHWSEPDITTTWPNPEVCRVLSVTLSAIAPGANVGSRAAAASWITGPYLRACNQGWPIERLNSTCSKRCKLWL